MFNGNPGLKKKKNIKNGGIWSRGTQTQRKCPRPPAAPSTDPAAPSPCCEQMAAAKDSLVVPI